MESKNIFQRKGLFAEKKVAQCVIGRGWQFDFYRRKINNTEIDLQFSKSNKILLIEVKFLNNDWRSFERIHQNQISRLQQALTYVRLANPGKQIQGFVAFVDQRTKITFVSLDDV